MVSLEQTSEGIILPVKAQPAARRNGITGHHDGALKVAVTQAPEKGKATAAIIAVIAKSLDLKKSQIELVSGQTSTHKKFIVRGISLEELNSKIAFRLAQLESIE